MFLPGRGPLAIANTHFHRETGGALSPPALAVTGVYPSTTLLCIFYALQVIGGQIGFPLILFIIAIRRSTLPGIRHPVFLNFYVTWIISSFSFCLLPYTGTQSGPEPPWSLCVTQAILGYSVPVLTGSALWAIVFHLWLSVNRVLENKRLNRYHNIWLVALPYLLAVGYVIYPTVLAIQQPASVNRAGAGFYCSLQVNGPSMVVASTVLLLLFVTTVLEILVGIKLWKNRSSFRSVRIQGWKSGQLFARLGLFHLYSLLALVTCVDSIVAREKLERIFFQASLPTVAFLAFGTRPGLFQRCSTAIHDERTSPTSHDSPYSIISSTDIGKQSRSRLSTNSRSTIRIWPFSAHQEPPSQARTHETHSNLYTSQPALRLHTDKSQVPSCTNSKDSYTVHGSTESGTATTTSLSAMPQTVLDESSKSQGPPPDYTTSPIALYPPAPSLTMRQHDAHNNRPITHQASENRPIRRLPTLPDEGQAPVPVQKEQVVPHHVPEYEVLRGKSRSRESNRSAISVTLIEVHTETSYHYDPPLLIGGTRAWGQ